MGVNIFLLDTTNSMSHTLKVTAMETPVIVNSLSLFPCLAYMDNFKPLSCGSLQRTDKCLIKLTKIDQTHFIKNRVVTSLLTCCRHVPLQSSIFVLAFTSHIMEVKRAENNCRLGLQSRGGYTPKSWSNVSNIWPVNLITSSLMFTSTN